MMLMPEYENVFKPGIIESHGGYPFTKIKPACAKILLEGAALYAKELGFSPHQDYHALKTIFGEQKLGFCWTRYRYGKDKMPYYTSHGHGCGFLTAEFLPIAALLKQLRSLLCAYFRALLSTKINSL